MFADFREVGLLPACLPIPLGKGAEMVYAPCAWRDPSKGSEGERETQRIEGNDENI